VAFRPLFTLIPIGLLLGGRPLEPAPRLRGDGHQSCGSYTRFKRGQKIGAVAIHAIGHDIPEGQDPFLPDALQHRGRQLRLRLKSYFGGYPALRPSGGIRGAKPDFRQEKPLIDECIPLPRSIPSKNAYLTILHFPQRATILSRHTHGVFALFDKARFIEHEDAIGLAQFSRHKLVVVPPHLLLIPYGLTEKALQAADTTPLDRQRHRLNRFPGKGAVLPDHVIQEMRAGFTPSKTVMEEALEFL
jgi:hypothetical protein